MTARASVNTRRLFFASWPDARQRDALWSVIQGLCPVPVGKPVPAGNLQVTLAFLGNVADDQMPALRDVAASHTWPESDFGFDRLAWWRRAKLLCLEASSLPATLGTAVVAFHEDLRRAGFKVDRRPFRAHITVARNVPSPPAVFSGLPIPPLAWPLQGMTLVASTPTPEGAVYEVLERF